MARRWTGVLLLFVSMVSGTLFGQGARVRQESGENEEVERDQPMAREQWFRKGRSLAGQPAAEMLQRAQEETSAQRRRRASLSSTQQTATQATSITNANTVWTPLGPAPILADPTGSQDYGPLTGRATSVAVDQNDVTGNTVYLGGAYGGLWRSANAASPDAASVTWTPLLDREATLAVGAVAVHPANPNILLVGTGEANNALDSYYGFGIYRSTDAGASWTLISSTTAGQSFRGLAFSRIAWSRTNPNVVVAAAASSSLGSNLGLAGASVRGIYFSIDAGATWAKASISDAGVGTPDAASVASVQWNAADHRYYAALRYHGVYVSQADDPSSFTRLANQPRGLTSANCPLWVPSSGSSCPMYRGELASHPTRNELYLWFVDAGMKNQGVWKSLDSGATWMRLSTASMDACGDSYGGCGTEQAFYNMTLLALPNPADANSTDLYAGGVNIFKCTMNAANPTCSGGEPSRFMNVTHVYGCTPIGSSSHVHPDEHQFDSPMSHANIVYFANDGGLYRTLNSAGINTSACTRLPFDNLNTNMGSMTQFVWVTPSPADEAVVLGGTQDNGSAATGSDVAGAGQPWRAVNNGDGGYNDILPQSPSTWLTAHNKVSIQSCTMGSNCFPGRWSTLVGSANVGGDDGAFYTPFMLDPQAPTRLLVGTCRVHRGSSSGLFSGSALSNNLWTSSATKCVSGSHPMISALAAGGAVTGNGSQVIYAGNDAGQIFVTTAADSGVTSWSQRTPSITLNPGAAYVGWRFKISSLAVDLADPTGRTAYATVQGFGSAHVIKTMDAGANWTNISADLPDSPANNLAIDPDDASRLYVASDVGVFVYDGTHWSEIGPDGASGDAGYLPNVAVLRIAVSKVNGKKLLTAGTYGRGVWRADFTPQSSVFVRLVAPVAGSLAMKAGQSAGYNLNVVNQGGFANTVAFTCATWVVNATCTVTPGALALNGNSGSIHVTVKFGNTAAANRRERLPWSGIALVLPGIVLLGGGRKKRIAWIVTLSAAALMMVACGGGGGGSTTSNTVVAASPSSGTAAWVQVTATSGTNSTSFRTSVTVQ